MDSFEVFIEWLIAHLVMLLYLVAIGVAGFGLACLKTSFDIFREKEHKREIETLNKLIELEKVKHAEEPSVPDVRITDPQSGDLLLPDGHQQDGTVAREQGTEA